MISMFDNHNSTNKYVVIIDGHLGLYDKKCDADAVYDRIDSIEDSPFGAIQYMYPNEKCLNCINGEHYDIADHIASAENLNEYIDSEIKKSEELIKKILEERSTKTNEISFDIFAQ